MEAGLTSGMAGGHMIQYVNYKHSYKRSGGWTDLRVGWRTSGEADQVPESHTLTLLLTAVKEPLALYHVFLSDL